MGCLVGYQYISVGRLKVPAFGDAYVQQIEEAEIYRQHLKVHVPFFLPHSPSHIMVVRVEGEL